MKKKQIESAEERYKVVDTWYGEIIGPAAKYRERKTPKNHYFFMTFYTNLAREKKNVNYVHQLIVGEMDQVNLLFIEKRLKYMLETEFKIKPNYLSKTLSRMVDTNLLIKLEQDVYFVNPFFFAKGEKDTIETKRNKYTEYHFKLSNAKMSCVKEALEEEQRVAGLEAEERAILSETMTD